MLSAIDSGVVLLGLSLADQVEGGHRVADLLLRPAGEVGLLKVLTDLSQSLCTHAGIDDLLLLKALTSNSTCHLRLAVRVRVGSDGDGLEHAHSSMKECWAIASNSLRLHLKA